MSYNALQLLNVGPEGMVFNNSGVNVQTQLAGWIAANPHLIDRTATIIIGAVNSSDPSQLAGPMEIGGSRAQLIISNPSGITCDGCDFINASRATLTTGVPQFNAGGSLTGYLVRGGHIHIGARGMDASGTDYTDLLARTLAMAGNVKANTLNVVLGANAISTDLSRIERVDPDQQATPAFALDVAALGGMYAGKITLLVNELGVGARHAGTLAAGVGDVILSVSGQLLNRGQIQASAGSVKLDVGALDNAGTIVASERLQTQSAQGVINRRGGRLLGRQQRLAAATLSNEGDIGAETDLHLTVDGLLDNQTEGRLIAGSTRLFAGQLHNRGLIDGSHTRIKTDVFNLFGAGAAYGDHLAIDARVFNLVDEHGKAGVASARRRFDLGVHTLTMGARTQLFSDGDFAIGGRLDDDGLATGQADRLTLTGASLDAMGKLKLDARVLQLINARFETALRQDPGYPQAIEEYQGSGASQRHLAGSPGVYPLQRHGSTHLRTPQGLFERWLRYRYQRNVLTEVVTHSEPAQISVGEHADFNVETVLNDKSRVLVSGRLSGQLGTLTNIDGQGRQVTHEEGEVRHHWRQVKKRRKYNPFSRGGVSTGSHSQTYRPPEQTRTIVLQPAQWLEQTTNVASFDTPLMQTPRIDNRLFLPARDPQAAYWLETDPRFTQYRRWLSTDIMLQQLASPTEMQKRLGDGYYEQRLVREQVAQLTGRRFLPGFRNDEEQFRALMNHALTQAKALDLQLGVALTGAQAKRLTSNIVWLVKQQVTLPDGRVSEALVPKVYARPDSVRLNGAGTLISADELDLKVDDTFDHGGTLAGWQRLSIEAKDIVQRGGQLAGDRVTLTARNDFTQQGGHISGQSLLDVNAGRDLLLRATTRDSASAQGQRTDIADVASLSASGADALLRLNAGRDIKARAARIENAGAQGRTVLSAGNDLLFGTVDTRNRQTLRWDNDNWRHDAQNRQVGSSVWGLGDVSMTAGRDVTMIGADVTSAQGRLDVTTGRNVNALDARATAFVDQAHRHTSKGWFSSTTTTTRDTVRQDQALGSTLSGAQVGVKAGGNILARGSHIVGDQNVDLLAGQDIALRAASNTFSESHHKTERTSGLFSSGGIGITLGTRQQSLDQQGVTQTASASTVGSTQGNITLKAGEHYSQTGSDVIAPQGNIAIEAKRIAIVEAREISQNQIETQFKQSGLTVAITSPVISALQTTQQMQQAARDTSDPRMKALAAANIALAGKNAVDAVQAKPSEAGGINLAISLGSSKNESKTHQTSDSARRSTVVAGGHINMDARGAGPDSDITLQGSSVTAEQNIRLTAENAINLIAAQNTAEQHSTNKNASASIGISYGSDGLLFTASASGGRGKADGSDITWTHTHAQAGNQLQIQSGTDTTMKGAVASGKQVIAEVGGNLNIESLQDTSTFASKQQSLGGSLSVGYGKMGGSLSASNSKVDSHFASVSEQSGIRAGDGGFQVDVGQDTTLTGGAITSTQQAIDHDKNRFSSGGTLTTRDIQNQARYQASSVGINLGAGTSVDGTLAPQGTSAGIGQDSGNASSTTQAAISGIAGNKDARTGDAETGIAKIFDADKVQKEINAQVQITQTFMREAPKAAANYAQNQITDLQNQIDALQKQQGSNADPAQLAVLKSEQQKWGEGGVYRVAMYTAIGALSGGMAGAVGAGTAAAAAPALNDLQGVLAKRLEEAGANATVAQAAAQLITGTTAAGLGSVASGGTTTGAATAFNADANNRQLHLTEAQKLASLKAGKSPEAQRRLEAAACALVRCADGVPSDDPNYSQLQALQQQGQTYQEEQIALLKTGEFVYQPYLDAARDFLTKHGEAQQRIGGVIDLAAGSAGTVGGGAIAATGAVGCAPTAGASCTLVPLGTYLAVASSQQAQEGSQAALGAYQSTEGERVIASFKPETYPGERDPLKEVGVDAAKLGLTALAGKLVPKALAKAEGLEWSANKSSASEYIPAQGKTTQPINIDGKFETLGLRDVDPMRLPGGARMVKELELAGVSSREANLREIEFINSGSTPPIATPIGIHDRLVKVVPTGGQPSASTGYWLRESELAALQKDPANIANKLGLPPGMHVDKFDVYQITPKQGVVVFESKIAPTTVNGVASTTGGATQTIVVNRTQFTPPIKTGSINVKKGL